MLLKQAVFFYRNSSDIAHITEPRRKGLRRLPKQEGRKTLLIPPERLWRQAGRRSWK